MDRDQAFAFLGLPDDATQDEIDSRVDARRRQLELRLRAAVTQEQQRLLERALTELEEARAIALLDPRDPAAGLPGGATIVLKPGTMLADRYVVKARLGIGERGAVFRALDLTWGRDVAIKVLLPESLLVPGTVDRLAAVLRRNLAFAHPGLCSTYTLGRSGGVTFIAMELIEGETLRQYLSRHRERTDEASGLGAVAIEDITRKICAALHYAAERTPHLNLKPENVLIGRGGVLKLTDFGLDEVITSIPRGRSRPMTEQRRFRAPEQVRRSRNLVLVPNSLDSRADQYSVAALVYFLATGEAPVADAADLGLRRPDLPPAMVEAVRRALSSVPEARYDTLDAFEAALFNSPFRRFRRAALIVALAGVVMAAAFLAVWHFKPSLLHLSALTGNQAEQQQALALRHRTDELRNRLAAAERDLRLRLASARRDVEARERNPDFDGNAALVKARATRDMLTALSDLATPQIFNSPDILNAYNLLGLAAGHLEAGRYRDAVAVLSAAEPVLAARLADLKDAEHLARTQYAGQSAEAQGPDRRLRDVWGTVMAERHRFAESIDAGMVLIPGGHFAMGDVSGDGSRAELPVHQVAIAPFKLGRTPVTRAEFAACVAANACRPDALGVGDQGDNALLPAVGVSWIDAQDYTAWLRARTGEDYRLPSEAEWEYAARAGSVEDYPWGPAVGRNHANCASCGSLWDRTGPAPVGSFPANAFGLRDMIGNVWQWTADCWYRDYSTAPATGTARDEFGCPKRVLRGGSWDNDAWMARASYRSGAPVGLRQDINGFRIAKSVD